jgi:hypothetical protein
MPDQDDQLDPTKPVTDPANNNDATAVPVKDVPDKTPEPEEKEEIQPHVEEKPEPVTHAEIKEPVAVDSHQPIPEDPRITDRDKSFKNIFGSTNNNDDDGFYPLNKKTDKQSSTDKNDDHIEIQQYDISSKKEEETQENNNSSNQTNSKASKPNVFEQVDNNRAAAMATVVSIFVLVIGLGGGFFSYKYWPNILSKSAVSADQLLPDKTTSKPTNTPVEEKTEITPTETDIEKTVQSSYTNTKYKYSLKYEESLFSQNTGNTQADNIILSNQKIGTASTLTSGFKIEVSFQESNSKLLKDWIADDNIISNYGKPELTSLKIDGKDAYQQAIDVNGKSINTYVFQADKVMVISYFAAAKDFETNKKNYQDLIDSIKLL